MTTDSPSSSASSSPSTSTETFAADTDTYIDTTAENEEPTTAPDSIAAATGGGTTAKTEEPTTVPVSAVDYSVAAATDDAHAYGYYGIASVQLSFSDDGNMLLDLRGNKCVRARACVCVCVCVCVG